MKQNARSAVSNCSPSTLATRVPEFSTTFRSQLPWTGEFALLTRCSDTESCQHDRFDRLTDSDLKTIEGMDTEDAKASIQELLT